MKKKMELYLKYYWIMMNHLKKMMVLHTINYIRYYYQNFFGILQLDMKVVIIEVGIVCSLITRYFEMTVGIYGINFRIGNYSILVSFRKYLGDDLYIDGSRYPIYEYCVPYIMLTVNEKLFYVIVNKEDRMWIAS